MFFLLHLRVGVGAALGNPSPLGVGLGVNFLSSMGLGTGLSTMKRGRGCQPVFSTDYNKCCQLSLTQILKKFESGRRSSRIVFVDLKRYQRSMERLRLASKISKRSWYQIDEPKTVTVEKISFEIQKMSRVVFSGYV